MNGYIVSSPIDTLRNLRIYPMPARAMADARILRVPDTSVIVAIDKKGRIYSSQVDGGPCRWCTNLTAGRLSDTISGLIRLGVVTQAAVKEHQEQLTKASNLERRQAAAEELCEAAGILGMKMTQAQLVTLELALGGGARARARMADKLGQVLK